jgi:hypothetical protein
MNALLRSLLIAACLCGAGCSALSDFSGYGFNEPDDDGGTDEDPTAGEGGSSGQGGDGDGDGDGDSGQGGTGGMSGDGDGDGDGDSGEGGASGTGGDGDGDGDGDSGEGGMGGQGGDSGVEPACTDDDDCEDNEMCSNEMCVPVRIPSGVLQSAGGGDVASTNYKMRISIGVPQPMGRASSTNFIITVGPGAGRP